MAGELKTIYNNNIIRTSTADDTFTLNCNGKLMASDVTIQATDVDSLTVTYGGNTIATGSGTVTKILNCDGRVATSDIGVAVTMNSAPSYPVKGDVITLNMDGTDRNYRVLKISGSVAEVLAQFSAGNSRFASSGQVYAGQSLDTFLNSTWYNTCTAAAKTAIVDKTFKQDSWYTNTDGDPDYHGVYNFNTHYDISLGNTAFGNEITRHIYALSAQDVIDYLEVAPSMTYDNTTLNMANVQSMFNVTSGNVWLRSALVGYSTRAINIYGSSGYVRYAGASTSTPTRPAFQIDLDKIAWSPSGGA